MLIRLPALLALLAALARPPASASAITNPFPLDSTTIVSGNDALDAALPAPFNRSYVDKHGAMSDDGRFVAFTSDADGLSSADDDSVGNVYVKDRATGAVIRRTAREQAHAPPRCPAAQIEPPLPGASSQTRSVELHGGRQRGPRCPF